jgi:hypothetical protein
MSLLYETRYDKATPRIHLQVNDVSPHTHRLVSNKSKGKEIQ